MTGRDEQKDNNVYNYLLEFLFDKKSLALRRENTFMLTKIPFIGRNSL